MTTNAYNVYIYNLWIEDATLNYAQLGNISKSKEYFSERIGMISQTELWWDKISSEKIGKYSNYEQYFIQKHNVDLLNFNLSRTTKNSIQFSISKTFIQYT